MKLKFVFKFVSLLVLAFMLFFNNSYAHSYNNVLAKNSQKSTGNGITEVVPEKSRTRYQKWKEELLATDFGRNLWETYQNKENFTLTVKVVNKDGKGAGTSDYVWNEAGELIGATISLDSKLDKGFPDPVYYPVMNSIQDFNAKREISGNVLAAAKFAHEFGHVNLTYQSNQEKVVLQNKLMPVYKEIFLSNGYNLSDPKLLEMTDQMGGTPNQIWENREYWGEVSAMNFLLEKTSKTDFYCALLDKMENNISFYAKGYQERFNKVLELKSANDCSK
jgi:hypothetical protein